MKKVKALGLCSGGLDSILSALVLKEQKIYVEWITFETPFFSADNARQASLNHGINLTIEKITPVYLEMLVNPPRGYGKYMNPCLDCHALMFKLAGRQMEARGFDFLFSGEVAGQRPMSQTKPSLRYVEKQSGYDGLILRPLSARCLPVTIPESSEWVDREKLLALTGRSRKPQIELARSFGVKDYPAPAGGCLLTDKEFSTRLKDLFQHQHHYPEFDLMLLKYGRHFRLNASAKLIIGRSHQENQQLMTYYHRNAHAILKVSEYPGPTALLSAGADSEAILQAASICAAYSKAPQKKTTGVGFLLGQEETKISVVCQNPSEFQAFLINSG